MITLTYAATISRLSVLNTNIEHNTIQKYNQNGVISKPAYDIPGGPAQFTVHAPLQAYAAKQMTMTIKSSAVKEAREIVEFIERRFESVQVKGRIKLLVAKLLNDPDLITLLSGKSEGAFRAWQWAEYKSEAAGVLMNYDDPETDPAGTLLINAQERKEYSDIYNNLTFPGRVIDFLKKYRGELVTLANGFKLQSKSTPKSN